MVISRRGTAGGVNKEICMAKKRYEVLVKIGVNASNEKEAKEKVKALLTDGYYNGKFLKFGPSTHFDDMRVREIAS